MSSRSCSVLRASHVLEWKSVTWNRSAGGSVGRPWTCKRKGRRGFVCGADHSALSCPNIGSISRNPILAFWISLSRSRPDNSEGNLGRSKTNRAGQGETKEEREQ